MDPRHPLFGQSFPLIGITKRPYLGECCIVLFCDSVEQYVPVAVTDRSTQPPTIYHIPLSATSVQQLLETHEQIMLQVARRGTEDEFAEPEPPVTTEGRDSDSGLPGEATDPGAARADLGSVDARTAANGFSDVCEGLPKPRESKG